MRKEKRFIQSAIATATKLDTIMPWARGMRRTEFVAKRDTTSKILKTA